MADESDEVREPSPKRRKLHECDQLLALGALVEASTELGEAARTLKQIKIDVGDVVAAFWIRLDESFFVRITFWAWARLSADRVLSQRRRSGGFRPFATRLLRPSTELSDRETSRIQCSCSINNALYSALRLGFEVARRGGTAGAVLNAANEAAVARFLDGRLGFNDIPRLCQDLLDNHDFDPSPDLDELLRQDRRARAEAELW